MILGMHKKTKRDDKLLGLIGVLSGTSMLHEGHRQSRATRFKHGYKRKLTMNHGQTFLLKGNFIIIKIHNILEKPYF